MADIFLSYARADYETALKVRDALEALDPDLSVFWDITGLDAGDVFPEKLETEVRDARVVLGIWNDNALGREWVKREVDIAYDKRTLLPVEIGPVTDKVISSRLDKVHRIKLHDFDGSADHPGWQETVKSLAQRLKRPDLIKARKTQAKEEARAKKLEAENKKLRKSKGGIRPWQWAVGGLASLGLATGAGYAAMEWQEERFNERTEEAERFQQLANFEFDDPRLNDELLLLKSYSPWWRMRYFSRDAIKLGWEPLLEGYFSFYENDWHNALSNWELACTQGNPHGCSNLGFLYENDFLLEDRSETNQTTTRDQTEVIAQDFYRKGCDGGSARGCNHLATFYHANNPSEAALLYEQGCSSGSALACIRLAGLYEVGNGVNQDLSNSRNYYERACNGGYGGGCMVLADYYYEGRGIEKDYVRARELYEQACDGGIALGCTNLGILYGRGQGVDQDYVHARELYQQGCDGDSALGCSYHGDLVYRGLGGPEDKTEGIRLLREGCDDGDEWGCNELVKYGH